MRYPSLRNLVIAIVMTGTCVAVSGALPAPEPTAPVADAVEPAADPRGAVLAAHDQRLDLAHAAIKSAIALLNAAQNPVATNPDRPFGGHRTKAIRYLERATSEILAAMEYADQ